MHISGALRREMPCATGRERRKRPAPVSPHPRPCPSPLPHQRGLRSCCGARASSSIPAWPARLRHHPAKLVLLNRDVPRSLHQGTFPACHLHQHFSTLLLVQLPPSRLLLTPAMWWVPEQLQHNHSSAPLPKSPGAHCVKSVPGCSQCSPRRGSRILAAVK